MLTISAVTLGTVVVVPLTLAAVDTAVQQNQQQGTGIERNFRQQANGMVGSIASINGNTITLKALNGTTYTVDASKAQVLVDGKVSSLAFLAVNDEIHVRGTPGTTDTTTITAQTIMKGDIASIPRVQTATQIRSINGNTLTFTDAQGTTYTVDATNAKITVDGKDSTLSNLAGNDIVLIQGIRTGTNTITAHMIAKGILPEGPGRGMGFRGPHGGGFGDGMGRGMGMRQNQGTTTTTTNQ
jgi:hypothetical protein